MELIKCEFLLYRFDVDYLGTAIQHFYGKDVAARKIIFKYMRHNSDIMKLIHDSFTVYLQQMCCSFYKGIKKYVKGIIELNTIYGTDKQIEAYNDCLEKRKADTQWIVLKALLIQINV